MFACRVQNDVCLQPLIRTNMASVSEQSKCLFFVLFLASVPECTGTSRGSVFVKKPDASGFLQRSRRANFFLEEFKQGNLERECMEEKCSYEEAKEIFAQPQQLENFWRTYTAVDQCLSSPCKNGATCTRHVHSYVCKCRPGFHGSNCDKVRATSHGCRYKNGRCEHFCRELPDQPHVCFCAPGYKLDRDNSSCQPQEEVVCGRPLIHFAPRVVNGQICPKGHCPWQALLTENDVFICGAVVLSDQWFVTAAHCVWKKSASVFTVTVGEHDLDEEERTEQRRRVMRVVVHPSYNQTNSDSDLAMLKLQRPIRLGPHALPVCLPAINSTFSRTLASVRVSIVSGWGRVAQHGAASRLLQRAVLPRVPLQECRRHTRLDVTRNMMCAGLRGGGRDACEGDSGGPLVTRYRRTWFLTGVVSWGRGCAQENTYGVYAKVSNYLSWILEVMATG
ncbi:coagulation factor VII isoform X1 [Gouania willdenowi]|uniref:Coagulation factor IX-like n=1 Tax=Gouania willdenowi TaxID=441366 RepID=A0A8C5DE89_GOUWI|nr:coagulation factor VII-like isoform X1 [Gouania willdenowi]